MSSAEELTDLIAPLDRHNQRLLSHVHPSDWQNPTPTGTYDLVVIGAGTAGLVTAAGAAGLGLGLKIALVEKHLMGGDCLNVGCIPSKCLIRSSRIIGELRQARSLGIQIDESAVTVDFPAVMERMRQLRASISHHDSAQRFRELGIDVFFGQAHFCDRSSIQVGTAKLAFKKAVIATGAQATQPIIRGIQEVSFLTSETVFSLTELPQRLAVIGGGPIGCELAQAFQRLGSQVILLHQGPHLLSKEDADAAEIIQKAFIQDGIQLALSTHLDRVEQTVDGKTIYFQTHGHTSSVIVDEILVSIGRTPTVQGLHLEAAGVVYDPQRGIKVNDYLQTTNPKIYAAGDVCMDWKFTHAADAAARLIIKNSLFSPLGLGKSKMSDLTMPWVTFTDPEVAHVGLSETAAQEQGIAIATITILLSKVDRAIADGETAGFIKIHHQQGSDQIVGATIVARHAGEMISEVTAAIAHKLGLSALSHVIHPYPTQAEGIKKAADTYRRTLLTPKTQRILKLIQKLS